MHAALGRSALTVSSSPAEPREPAVAQGERPDERRTAAAELAAAVRALTDATVRTEAPVATLREITRRLTDCLPALTAEQRQLGQPAPLDEPASLQWFHNPVVGRGNPLAAPVTSTLVDGVLFGRCTLGLPYQGPRGYVHGGVSALLLDQILGDVISASGRGGLTVHLATRYRRPVPLERPLLVTARVVEVLDRKITAAGSIALEAEPENILVEGVGTFVVPRPDQAARIFGSSGSAARHTAFSAPPAAAAGADVAGSRSPSRTVLEEPS